MSKYSQMDLNEIFASKSANLQEVITKDNLRIEAYHINKRDNLNIHQYATDIENNLIINYYVVSGAIDIIFTDKKETIRQGQIISIFTHENINIFALEDSNILTIFSTSKKMDAFIDNKGIKIFEMVNKAEKDDPYVHGHNYRVGRYTMLFLQEYHYGTEIGYIHFAAAAHDIGKMYVDKEILNKTSRLTPEEFEQIKIHPVKTYETLLPILGEKYANMARWHHEKLDGSGYPDGLIGDQIPIESRAMAVADIFDALTTSRSYRKAFSFEKALSILDEDVSNNKIDKKFVDILKRLIDEKIIVEGFDNLIYDESQVIEQRISNKEEYKL